MLRGGEQESVLLKFTVPAVALAYFAVSMPALRHIRKCWRDKDNISETRRGLYVHWPLGYAEAGGRFEFCKNSLAGGWNASSKMSQTKLA